ncbi:MAG: ComF family protein [Holosporales bacterium]|jgi:ComF family protein|nr:ComF family protein [Holosporales bacterium]
MLKFWESITNWLFPEKCLLCGCEIFQKGVFCPKCFPKLTFIDHPICERCGKPLELAIDGIELCFRCVDSKIEFDFCRSLLVYDAYSKKLVMKIKKQADSLIAQKCCSIIAAKYKTKIFDTDFIIPTPSHWSRILRRGYNPATIIAKELSKILNIPVNANVLKRIRKTEYQKNKSISEREENVKGAFSCLRDISGKKVILVDDVFTTGATLNECSKILKSFGAKVIYCITIASTNDVFHKTNS